MNALETDKDYLQTQVNNLETDKEDLQNQLDSLQIQKDTLQNQLNLLNVTYQNYVSTHKLSNSEYDEVFFYFYYVVPEEQKFGVYDLEEDLYGIEWIEPYKEGVFDCSEMSAVIERYLENEGWNAIIVCGKAPSNGGDHAWVLVETSEGHYMPVESTNIEIVWWDNPYFNNYFTYDYMFETIQEAIDYNESEFDWWK